MAHVRDHPTGEGENHLVYALRSTCLWRKEYIKLPNWTPPPPPPSVSQGIPHPPPTHQGTPLLFHRARAVHLLWHVRAILYLHRRVSGLRRVSNNGIETLPLSRLVVQVEAGRNSDTVQASRLQKSYHMRGPTRKT